MKLNFRPWYERHDTPGVYSNAIVVYATRPYERRVRQPDLLHPNRWEQERDQNRLRIDLLFLVLQFDWIDEWPED